MLSVCMIVKDEERVLGNCLKSIKGLADEIVVIDTGSTDRTVEIARSFGAKVYFFQWCDDFSAARNQYLQHATGDWILWVDADDVLPERSARRIKRLVKSASKDSAFFFVLKSPLSDGTISSMFQLRMFPNLPGIEYRRPIHEEIITSLSEHGVKRHHHVKDIEIIHTGYADPAEMAQKRSKYEPMMLRWLEDNPKDHILRLHLALLYSSSSNTLDRAIEEFLKLVNDPDFLRMYPHIYGECLTRLGELYHARRDYDLALNSLHRAIETKTDVFTTHALLAQIYAEMGMFDRAMAHFRAIEKTGVQETLLPMNVERMRAAVLCLEGKVLERQGRFEEAMLKYEEAIRRAPKQSIGYKALSRLYLLSGHISKAHELLDRAIDDFPDDPGNYYRKGCAYLVEGKLDEAERSLEMAIERGLPNAARAYFRLGLIYEQRGQLERAEEAFLKAIELAPRYSQPYVSLGKMYIGKMRRNLEGVEMLRKAVQIKREEIETAKRQGNLGDIGFRNILMSDWE
jgi:tetratricopeptide (TPR) repeat protein